MTGQDERDVLLGLLTHLPAGVTEEGQEIPLLHMLPESAREYLRDAILAAGFHLTPIAEVKAEALAQIIEPLLAAHGTKARNAYYVRCRCGYSKGGAEGPRPTLHAHEAQVTAEAIAAHLRENGGA